MADLLGFGTILFVTLVTFIIGARWPEISKIVFAALLLRILIMLIGHYGVTLPDSTRDAVGFEWGAWERAKDGILNVLNNYPGMNMYFYQWIIAIPYSLFGRSVLMMQSIGLLFGVGNVLLGWLLAKKLWGNFTANKVGWVLALFPSLALYAILPLREVYASFFLLIAMFGVVNWVRHDKFKSIILALFGFVAGTYFHGGIIIGAFIFSIFVFSRSFKKALKSILSFRINLKSFTIIFLTVIFLLSYFSNKIFIPKFGKFKDITNLNRMYHEVGNRLIGDASYPDWLKVEEPTEIIYKGPIRITFLLFSPFPWDVEKPSHLVGMFDGFLYIILIYLIFRNIRVIWKDPALKIIFIILVFYIMIFAFGVSNFGAGIRHRSKFLVEIVILAAPLLPKLTFPIKEKLRRYLR